jgi:hypothetical protein
VAELERAAREGDAARRWPSLGGEIMAARQRALLALRDLGAVGRAAATSRVRNRAAELFVQFTALSIAISRQFSSTGLFGGEDHYAAAIRALSSIARDWVLAAFDGPGGDTTLLAPAPAAALLSLGGVVRAVGLLAAPLGLWVAAAGQAGAGAAAARDLEALRSARALVAANQVVPLSSPQAGSSSLPSGEEDLLGAGAETEAGEGRWASDGPAKEDGIALHHVTAVGAGRVRLRDVTAHIPAGKLTLLIGSRSAEAEMGALLDVIWRGAGGGGDAVSLLQGSVHVHGRDIKDWRLAALREKIIFMKDTEARIPMTLGKLSFTLSLLVLVGCA